MSPTVRRAIMGSVLNPIQRVLQLVGMASSWRDVTYMFHPANSALESGKRHYLYIAGQWVDPTTLDTSMGAMVGTLNADGTGGSLSYTPEIVAPTTVEAISILYTNTNVVVPILSIGFKRALTADERTSLASLVSPIATAAGLSPAACSLVTGQEFQQRCLKMKINTALAGSANDSFVLPAAGAGTYAYTVDWGNGTREYVTANTAQTKDYNATSIFVVSVYGTYRPYFNHAGDKAKLILLQIGATNHTTLANAFDQCTELVGLVGYADTSNVTSFASTFIQCAKFNSPVTSINTSKATSLFGMFSQCTIFNQSLSHFDTSLVENMSYMFMAATAFNQSLVSWNTSKVTAVEGMFFSAGGFKQSLASFNMEACANVSNMLTNANINATGTTTNYDNTLIAWAAQNLVNSKTFTATNCKYGGDAGSGGQQARTAIAADDSWTFVDGGHI